MKPLKSPVSTLIVFALTGCANATQEGRTPSQAPPPEENGALPDISKFNCNFTWQQTVSASYGPLTSTFDAIVECSDGELRMVGLTPFKTRAFLLTQKGQIFHFEKFVDRELPFSPKQILVDLHRTFFIGFQTRTEERTERYFQEERVDDARDGKLWKRRLKRVANESGSISIDYEGGFDGTVPPSQVVLTNGYYGYRLVVETVSVQSL
jgi:hypothetical protein